MKCVTSARAILLPPGGGKSARTRYLPLRATGQDVHVVTGIDGPAQQVPADTPGGTPLSDRGELSASLFGVDQEAERI